MGPGTRVFVKPNLTWRTHIPGVTVRPEFLEALTAVLVSRGAVVYIGESDGGYHGFVAEQAFEGHGLYRIAAKYGARLVNLSTVPSEEVTVKVGNRTLRLRLPTLLLRDVDVFITVPVPKVHAMTGVSLAFKNQWGCLPDPMRLRQHHQFAEAIIGINKALRPKLALFDAEYILNKNGPLIGEPMRKGLLIAARDLGAGSLVCCLIMGIDPWSIKHHRLAAREGMFPMNMSEVELNTQVSQFCTERCSLQHTLVNRLALLAFNSRFLTTLLYDSWLADLAHRALYTLRRNRLLAGLFYGNLGPPPIEGSRTPKQRRSLADRLPPA